VECVLTPRSPCPARGFVVLVALVALLVMALSAIALVRSVEVTIAVAGNLGFMQSAQAAADDAVEHVIAVLFEQHGIADTTRDDTTHGYFASHVATENARGVPRTLQAIANYPADAPVLDRGNGNVVRWVTERMCIAAGAATSENCSLAPLVEQPPGSPGEPRVEPPLVPVFRVTVRVDGPGNAVQFVQAWVADIPGRRRLAWRALGD
jgi:type IV pilus assembly protein PilX